MQWMILPVGKVTGVLRVSDYSRLSKVSFAYNNERLEGEAAHNYILENYPYDGKSSFAELVAKESEKKD
ncbi:hypothetical protein [Treponema berlinense]|uniref:hypothetical protein n=1 Tax=Treponema berlinense TaxID=225004 RepID=UPI0026EE2660|nr:hypothetical protein [Treponema berlinense]